MSFAIGNSTWLIPISPSSTSNSKETVRCLFVIELVVGTKRQIITVFDMPADGARVNDSFNGGGDEIGYNGTLELPP